MEPYPAQNYDLTYICGLEIEEPTGLSLIEYLEEHRELTVCYAPGPRGVNIPQEKNSRIMDLHPILHINEQEALALSNQEDHETAAFYLQKRTKNTVIITLGAKGAYCLEKNGQNYLIPSVPVKKIGDTIGAGDAHIGAILACLTMDIPLYEAIAYANQISAAVVGVHGATLPPEALPPLPQLS